MDLNKINIRPFVEGFIRVASDKDQATGQSRTAGELEVLSRHHLMQTGVDAVVTPHLEPHPIGVQLKTDVAANKTADKLVEIPIQIFFDQPKNAITAQYKAYDAKGHPVCVGDGCNAKRVATEGAMRITTDTQCAGPELCEFANGGEAICRRQVVMPVQIKNQDNPLSIFEIRTSSFNSYKALRAQLELIQLRFGGLRHVPLKLQLWKSSNRASEYEHFDLLKLALDASSEVEAMRLAKKARQEEIEVGLGANHDAAFEALQGGDLKGLAEDDFADVRDFYQPTTTPAKRREGTMSVAEQTKTAVRKKAPLPQTANDIIGFAVGAATRAKTQSAEAM